MQYAFDINLALELCINKIEGEELMETVSFLTDAFALFLHLPKNKGASGSRDGWYPGLITTNASLQNKFEEEGETGSSSSEADAMLSRLGSRPDYIANFSLATETNPLKI